MVLVSQSMSLMLSHRGQVMAGGIWRAASLVVVEDQTLMNGEQRLES